MDELYINMMVMNFSQSSFGISFSFCRSQNSMVKIHGYYYTFLHEHKSVSKYLEFYERRLLVFNIYVACRLTFLVFFFFPGNDSYCLALMSVNATRVRIKLFKTKLKTPM